MESKIWHKWTYLWNKKQGFPGDPVLKNPPANAGDMGSIPGLGRRHGATKPMSCSHWEPPTQSPCSATEKPPQREAGTATQSSPREPQLEPACRQGSEENPRQSLILKKKQNHGHREHTGGCQGEAGWGGTEWEAEVSRRKLLYIERVNKNKILLHSTENRIQYPAVNHTEN